MWVLQINYNILFFICAYRQNTALIDVKFSKIFNQTKPYSIVTLLSP